MNGNILTLHLGTFHPFIAASHGQRSATYTTKEGARCACERTPPLVCYTSWRCCRASGRRHRFVRGRNGQIWATHATRQFAGSCPRKHTPQPPAVVPPNVRTLCRELGVQADLGGTHDDAVRAQPRPPADASPGPHWHEQLANERRAARSGRPASDELRAAGGQRAASGAWHAKSVGGGRQRAAGGGGREAGSGRRAVLLCAVCAHTVGCGV
ncbi:hypothetical protein GGX14DRAFT_399920 [Mycena pura]|uniref:Uncharacterized protein n=1 Tax=Mycena pura TaxID=153505 RepID=A0AAD6V344_9AGAR|nr:hypothetical protein GGX14DRAFT_399920 [Mycena pura]